MNALIKNIFFRHTDIKTFFISRLADEQILEKVFLKKDNHYIDITKHHSMICLDPFCISVWLPQTQAKSFDPGELEVQFVKGKKINAVIGVSLIEQIATDNGTLLLYKLKKVKNNQLNPLHRLVFLAYLIRSKSNTYYSRKVISALYSYPRSIIIVSYQDNEYYNIFPMDIQGYIAEEDLYILGLRTTNVTLNKILESKKVVVCDTDAVDINTVYNLGKHSSNAPTPKDHLSFSTIDSEFFGFPVPDFTGSYKEIKIIENKKMGYHMLLIGKVVNSKKLKEKLSPLYHVGFLQYQNSGYERIEGVF